MVSDEKTSSKGLVKLFSYVLMSNQEIVVVLWCVIDLTGAMGITILKFFKAVLRGSLRKNWMD